MRAYHGTSPSNAALIRIYGFRKGTWFALKREDALAYGGPYVFEVELDESKWDQDENDPTKKAWQVHANTDIPPSVIIHGCHYKWARSQLNHR